MSSGPESLLLGWWCTWFGNRETVRTGVMPHEVSIVQHLPTIWIPAHHAHAEVQLDVIVERMVV